MLSDLENSLPTGWEVYAVFRLFLLDQNKDYYLTLQGISHIRFYLLDLTMYQCHLTFLVLGYTFQTDFLGKDETYIDV